MTIATNLTDSQQQHIRLLYWTDNSQLSTDNYLYWQSWRRTRVTHFAAVPAELYAEIANKSFINWRN